ncbi:hypothetical protein [Candidatus Azobacteroides pseudotrichonymphae]|nr:hypothetical protein [Candidatus Azobacteroides pseudotrichonymphae]
MERKIERGWRFWTKNRKKQPVDFVCTGNNHHIAMFIGRTIGLPIVDTGL